MSLVIIGIISSLGVDVRSVLELELRAQTSISWRCELEWESDLMIPVSPLAHGDTGFAFEVLP